MEFKLLGHKPDAQGIIAKWYFDEWGYLINAKSADEVVLKIQEYLNTGGIPLVVLAIENSKIIGTANLKYREMSIPPNKEHWLGGVYVAKRHRGKGAASMIVKEAVSLEKSFGITTLHLQTEDLGSGLYKHLGWIPIEQMNYRSLDVLVMEITIGK